MTETISIRDLINELIRMRELAPTGRDAQLLDNAADLILMVGERHPSVEHGVDLNNGEIYLEF